MAILRKSFGPDSEKVANVLTNLVSAYQNLERYEEALAVFERRTDMLNARLSLQFYLARAQFMAGGPERAAARQRVLELREKADESTRAEIDTWLAAHPATP